VHGGLLVFCIINVGRLKMAVESKPRWKHAFWLAFKIYAGFCTLIVTACLALIVWDNFGAQSPPRSESPFGSEEITLMSAYGKYMASEYPRRGDYFNRMAQTLGWRSAAVPVFRSDVLKYLGKPDFMDGSLEKGTLIFTYYPSGATTNPWEVYAFLKEGKLAQIGFNDASVNNHSGYKPYPGESAPNEQGGAGGKQPVGSQTNRTSEGAVSRRPPPG
jgi:hypothetical protein